MANSILLRASKPLGTVVKSRWASLLTDDVIGIDGDIERLIDIYRARYGCPRDKANAALVDRLSRLSS